MEFRMKNEMARGVLVALIVIGIPAALTFWAMHTVGDSPATDLLAIVTVGCGIYFFCYQIKNQVLRIAQHVTIYWGLVFALFLMLGIVGKEFGVQKLIYHEHLGVALFNGFSLALHVGVVFFLIYAFDEEEPIRCKQSVGDLRSRNDWEAVLYMPFLPNSDDEFARIPFYVLKWSLLVGTAFAIVSFLAWFADPEIWPLPFVLGLYFGVIVNYVIAQSADRYGFPALTEKLMTPFDRRKQKTWSRQDLTERYANMRCIGRLPLIIASAILSAFVVCFFVPVEIIGIESDFGWLEYTPAFASINLLLIFVVSGVAWLGRQRRGAVVLFVVALGFALFVLNGVRLNGNNEHKFTYADFDYSPEKHVPLDAWLYQNMALRFAGMDGKPQVLLRSRGMPDIKDDQVAPEFKDDELITETWLSRKQVNVNQRWIKHVKYVDCTTRGREESDPPVLIVVTVSGGGIRAAYWTALVLQELEKSFAADDVYFPAHIRLVTGASGGMLAAARYVASIPNPDEINFKNEDDWKATREIVLEEIARSSGGEDALTPVLNHMLFHDVPGLFYPFLQKWDRGKELQHQWIDNWNMELAGGVDSPLKKSFKELREDERMGWCPSLVFSPMFAEDGRRLIISNLDLSYATRAQAGELVDPFESVIRNPGNELTCGPPIWRKNAYKQRIEVQSCSALELFRLFPDEDLQLAAAVRMSASFPFVSPATTLPTIPTRHLVDAGYYDNFGVNLGAQWIQVNHKSVVKSADFNQRSQRPECQPDLTSKTESLDGKFAAILLVRIRDHRSAATRKEMDQYMVNESAAFYKYNTSSTDDRNDEVNEPPTEMDPSINNADIQTTPAKNRFLSDWETSFYQNDGARSYETLRDDIKNDFPLGLGYNFERDEGRELTPVIVYADSESPRAVTDFSEYLKNMRKWKRTRINHGGNYVRQMMDASTRWLGSPWQGLGRARHASMMYRNDEQVESVNESLDNARDEDRQRVMTVVFDCETDASLSWYLTDDEKNNMKKEISKPRFANKLRALKHWWKDVEKPLDAGEIPPRSSAD